MASMRKKGRSGYYYARFYDPNRSPKQKTVALKTTRKDVARRRLADLEERYEKGQYDPWAPDDGPEALSLKEAAEQFLKSREHLREATQKRYASALRTLKKAVPAGLILQDVNESHLRPIIYDPSVKPATQGFRYRHLRAFFNWCVKQGMVEQSPLDVLDAPREGERVPEYLTPEQLERLLRGIDADIELKQQEGQLKDGEVVWLKDTILLAVNTGMRIGELCALRWRDVDLEEGFITVRNYGDGGEESFQSKSGDERAIPITTQAEEVLQSVEARRGAEEYVLRGAKGGKLNAEYASKRFKYYVRLAKLPEYISFHSLRHTCASWMVQRGVPLAMVQAILGHSSVQVTQKYAHHAPDALKKAMREALG